MKVIVMIRHPAAFVSSLKKLNWREPIWELASIKPLMEKTWARYADEKMSFSSDNYDIIEGGILMWKCLNEVISEHREQQRDWLFVRHEDLAADCESGFKSIFEFLGLAYSSDISRKIREYTEAKNPHDSMSIFDVRRNSKGSLRNWRHRLTEEEIHRIQSGTNRVSSQLYSDDEW